MMTEVWFIRHGESASNAGLRTEHPATIELTALGRQQATCVSHAFKRAPDLIVTSPYARTKDTAQATIHRFRDVPQAEWPVQEFTYLNPANWNGTTGQERMPAAHLYWERGDPYFVDGPGAESFAGLLERVARTRALIESQEGNFVAVFSHGQFSRAFWLALISPQFDVSSDGMRRLRAFTHAIPFPNGAILKFRFSPQPVWNSGILAAHLERDLLTY